MDTSFLEVIETYRAEQASVQTLFGSEGVGVRAAARRSGADYKGRLAAAAELLDSVLSGRRPDYVLREAMSTSDFPLLFGDIIDRSVLGAYQEYPATWSNFAQARTVRDFRTVNLFKMTGAEGVLDAVAELTEYPQASLDDAKSTLSVAKYGRTMDFSWETLINDDFGTFASIPQRYGRAARRTEQKLVTAQYVDANGPHASFYTTGNKNKVASNPVLSIAALQTAFGTLAAQLDADGEPVLIEAVELVVPPALEIAALNIVNATEITVDPNASAGTAQQQIKTANWIKQRVRVSVDPYIPIVASSANGNTSWFMFASPSNGDPALVGAHLRGHEQPEVFMREPNARRVGGGTINPTDGDFATDAVSYKVRAVFGAARLNPKMTVASSGAGS